MTFDVFVYPEIMRGVNPAPQQTLFADDTHVRTHQAVWQNHIFIKNRPLPLIALIAEEQWLEIDFPEPTTAVGVQFWGDENDGWARILVSRTDILNDAEPIFDKAWFGNTFGKPATPYENYIEIRNLPRDRYTLRIEAIGQAGHSGGDIHVTMVAFGWGPLPRDGALSVFSRGLKESGTVEGMSTDLPRAPQLFSRSLPEILSGKNPTPEKIVKIPEQLFQILPHELNTPDKKFEITSPRIRLNGPIWRGTVNVADMEPDPQVNLLALTGKGSWVEFFFAEPATAIGVQFWGDENDGSARILVDGDDPEQHQVWEGNTVGNPKTYKDYIEIVGLEHKPHTLRIEATGEIGQPGGDAHVTIAAFGLGETPQRRSGLTQPFHIFLPLIRND